MREWNKGQWSHLCHVLLIPQKMTARLFSKLRLWFNWHFAWDEFASTDGLVSTVVSIPEEIAWRSYCPVSLLHYSKGTHFSNPSPPPPLSISTPRSEESKDTRSQTRLRNTVCSEGRKLQNQICFLQIKTFLLESIHCGDKAWGPSLWTALK